MSSIDAWRRKQQRKKRATLIAVALVAVVALLAGFMWWNGSSDHAKKPESASSTPVIADTSTRRQFHQLETAIEQGDVRTQASFVASLFRDDFATKAQPMFPKGTKVHFKLGSADSKNTLITDSPETGQVECIVNRKQTYVVRILKENTQWRIIYTEPK